MTGGSLGLRTLSFGSLQSQAYACRNQSTAIIVRRPSKIHLPLSRDKEKLILPLLCRYLNRKKVGMLILAVFALLMFISSSFFVTRDALGIARSSIALHLQNTSSYDPMDSKFYTSMYFREKEHHQMVHSSAPITNMRIGEKKYQPHSALVNHWCRHFAFPPPPPPSDRKRFGPRPCPVCYLPVEEALSSMPSSPEISPVLRNLSYVHDQTPIKTESHGGSEFGGYPSLKQRNESFNINESMIVHCGFVKGDKPGHHSGFDIDEADLTQLEQFHEVIVASAIFGNYDIVQQPSRIGETSRKNVPFFMFIDEATGAYMRNTSAWDGSKRVGIWRIIVVRNLPFIDSRRNGKVPKLLLHRLFPKVRYSLWIDGKLELVVDPYQILEKFLWRENATFAISKHYKRFDVFEEAEANKAAGKYDNSSIDHQVDFYRNEALTPYSEAKLPISSDVPEGCVIIREHVPITNLFSCLWFNEVDRFTSRDQLSFSTVRDRIMSQVEWSVNMFLDCERRNFVVQAYHRDLLEQMSPPPPPSARSLVRPKRLSPVVRIPAKKIPARRGRGERKSGSKRHRKMGAGW